MPGYTFDVVIKDGVAQVLHMTPGIEDGIWSVGGTDDQWGAGIHITHKRHSGQYVAEAQHHHNLENYKAPDIPGLDKMKAAFESMGMSPAEAEKRALQTLSGLPGGIPSPEPPDLKMPSAPLPLPGGVSRETDLSIRGPVPKDPVNNDIPPGARPFDFNNKSTWPESLRKAQGVDGEEGDGPRMRGDVHL